jgi:cell division transport system permease protein
MSTSFPNPRRKMGFLRRAFVQMQRDRWLQAVALTTLTVALAIVGTYVALSINLAGAFSQLSRGTTLLAVLKDDASRQVTDQLAQEIISRPEVQGVNFVGKEQAMLRFARQLGPHKELLEGLQENPLPNALEVFIKPRASTGGLLQDLRDTGAVAEVVTTRPWLTRLSRAGEVFGQLAWVMGMLLFAGVVLMVSNTVRLAVYVRRDQLEVMDLVGASLNYIRLPFLAEAVMHGLIASLLASAVVLVLFLLLGGPMSLPLGLDLGNIFAFSWLVPPILAAVALAAALIGGFWGVGKALRAKVGS